MRLAAPLTIDTATCESQRAASARWLVALLRWIVGVLEYWTPHVQHIPLLREAAAAGRRGAFADLRACASKLRVIVTALAMTRVRRAPWRAIEILHPGSARGASRRLRRHTRISRRATAGLFRDIHTGSLRQRAERLSALLANLEPLIKRATKRLDVMWRFWRTARHALIVTHDACENATQAHVAAFVDSS